MNVNDYRSLFILGLYILGFRSQNDFYVVFVAKTIRELLGTYYSERMSTITIKPG